MLRVLAVVSISLNCNAAHVSDVMVQSDDLISIQGAAPLLWVHAGLIQDLICEIVPNAGAESLV